MKQRLYTSGLGLVLLALLMSLLPGSSTAGATASIQWQEQVAQPALPSDTNVLSVQASSQQLRVMVGTAAGDMEMTRHAAELGGQLIHKLSMLDAYALELPADSLSSLAQLPGVRWISVDAPVVSSGKPDGGKPGGGGGGKKGSGATVVNTYLDTLGVQSAWAMGLDGRGVSVAVIDSGIKFGPDFVEDPSLPESSQVTRIRAQMAFGSGSTLTDSTGHGTHVAGVIGGNGAHSNGRYTGIAPMVDLIELNISDGSGMAYESDTVAAMQWVLDNKETYNIRVVNLSINSTVPGSYHESALNAAAEILWFNGIVVVASAGNADSNHERLVQSAPANDPFLITVGALDEWATADRSDDEVAYFSATGTTIDGHVKPELVAPGVEIVSVLASNSEWSTTHGYRVVDNKYFMASGTSMAAPMVSGAIALLLQQEPGLTPDQVKQRLIDTSYSVLDYRFGNQFTAPSVPALDVGAALSTQTSASANTGLTASQLLWSGSEPVTWTSVNWNSVNWNSVNWNSVNWNSVNWNSVNWNSVFFGN